VNYNDLLSTEIGDKTRPIDEHLDFRKTRKENFTMDKNVSHSAYRLFSYIFLGWAACMGILIQYVATF
jgi:hypothetical protein